jgi:hypothetical protein
MARWAEQEGTPTVIYKQRHVHGGLFRFSQDLFYFWRYRDIRGIRCGMTAPKE